MTHATAINFYDFFFFSVHVTKQTPGASLRFAKQTPTGSQVPAPPRPRCSAAGLLPPGNLPWTGEGGGRSRPLAAVTHQVPGFGGPGGGAEWHIRRDGAQGRRREPRLLVSAGVLGRGERGAPPPRNNKN